jgi:N-acetyl-gamma-glutamylphosphate reductase
MGEGGGRAASGTPDASTSRTALNAPQFVFIEPDGDRPCVEPACFISVPFCRPPAAFTAAATAAAAAAAVVCQAASGSSGGGAAAEQK